VNLEQLTLTIATMEQTLETTLPKQSIILMPIVFNMKCLKVGATQNHHKHCFTWPLDVGHLVSRRAGGGGCCPALHWGHNQSPSGIALRTGFRQRWWKPRRHVLHSRMALPLLLLLEWHTCRGYGRQAGP